MNGILVGGACGKTWRERVSTGCRRGTPKARDLTYFLRWTCTALNTSSLFSTTKSPSRMRWSPGFGGCGPGCSPEPSMMLSGSLCFVESLQPLASRSPRSMLPASLPANRGDAEPSNRGRHRPHVLLAASAFRLDPLGSLWEPYGFRLVELLDWLHSVPPLLSCCSLNGSCVTTAPKKEFGRTLDFRPRLYTFPWALGAGRRNWGPRASPTDETLPSMGTSETFSWKEPRDLGRGHLRTSGLGVSFRSCGAIPGRRESRPGVSAPIQGPAQAWTRKTLGPLSFASKNLAWGGVSEVRYLTKHIRPTSGSFVHSPVLLAFVL